MKHVAPIAQQMKDMNNLYYHGHDELHHASVTEIQQCFISCGSFQLNGRHDRTKIFVSCPVIKISLQPFCELLLRTFKLHLYCRLLTCG